MTASKSSRKRLFLLDGMALAYRAYFAFIRNPLINSKGINTSGVFGFTNTLMRILKEEQPDYVAVVFDTSAPTFRHKKFPEYKATREKMPDELREQIPVIRNMVEAFNIPIVEKDGFEADDVIGTLARRAEAQGMEVFMATGDKDFMQLVSSRVKMVSLKRSQGETEILDSDGVIKKVGLPPEKIVDFLGLMGDTSDNVPGVPGVGPKTALMLIRDFGSMDNILEHLDEISRKSVQKNIREHREQALLSRELVTIHTDVPLDVKVEDLKARTPDQETLVSLFRKLEFNRMLQDISALTGKTADTIEKQYTTIESPEALNTFIRKLKGQSMFAMDLETTSLEPMTADIVGLSFSWSPGEAFYIPALMPEEDSGMIASDPESRLNKILSPIKSILENPDIRKCGQNIKYDMLVLKQHGINVKGVDFDSMVAAYLIDPSARQYNIDALAMQFLQYTKIPTKDLIGKGRNQITMDLVAVEKISEYACEDADIAFRLRKVMEPRLEKDGLSHLFQDVEMPLVSVLMMLEENGVALDTKLLREMSLEMQNQLNDLETEIYEIAGESFNINSTQQLGIILFEKLKVHEILGKRKAKRTKTGYATDVRVLESLSAHPLPKRLLDYRQLTKLKSTYVDALPALICKSTGRVHASFNQTVAATGRLSTSNPNLQNIPIRTELGREIRKAFVAQKPGWKLLSADYSQIELRLMAHLSGDKTLLESFQRGEDVHRRTASEIFSVMPEQVTPDLRRQAKTINFGIMYGMGAYGLASRLSISNEEAQNFISAYFTRYPKVNAFIAETIARAYKQGYVKTLMNRRRYLPELKSDNRNIRDFGERTAVNTPIQGTAADLIKIAMIHIAEILQKERWQSKMILQIHDELLFEAPESELDKLADMVRMEMEGAIQLDVPIQVDVGTGSNWFEAH
ncbi:DNA polymerase I [bacterium]|nr:DNA polymerase I [bacterium]